MGFMARPTPASVVFAACWLLGIAVPGLAIDASGERTPRPRKPPREICGMLDDATIRPLMDGVLNYLLPACGREGELGEVAQAPSEPGPRADQESGGEDILVNDPVGDAGASQTQSETSLAINADTGTLCSGYNDSFHRVQGLGVTGFSRSTDAGATFDDRGALDPESDGDPSLVWRRADGNFYFATLSNGGLALWVSSDDCRTFEPAAPIHEGASDDKEMLTVDNSPASPFFGRLYVAWTHFGAGGQISLSSSADGGQSWSDPVRVSSPNTSVQGAWPAVSNNGDVYVAWTRFASGRFSIEAARSTDGGRSFEPLAPPALDRTKPEDPDATSACARSALNGHIRHSPFPQIAVGPDGAVHVVYSYDPDGRGEDTVDVFYRRSTDNGTTWRPEIRLNDDDTACDQFFPTLSVGADNVVAVSWYDRRNDPSNLLIDHYQRMSQDGGASWGPNQRLSDISSPVYLDPEMATCYHGDYDTHIQTAGAALFQWSDDRNQHGGHNDPDVLMDPEPVSTDYLVVPNPWNLSVCAPDDAVFAIDVRQFDGYSDPVTLSVSGFPAGVSSFSINPVTPPGESELRFTATGQLPAGTHPAVIRGTSAPGPTVHTASITLSLFDAIPPPPLQQEPPDGSIDVDVRPILEWSATQQTTAYLVEIATDPSFMEVIYHASDTKTSHRIQHPLSPTTTYYWRTRGSNICGEGSWNPGFEFTTRRVPPILVIDDDDNDPDVLPAYEGTLLGLGREFDVWDTANSNSEPDHALLALYRVVIWFSGDEYGGAAGPGAIGEAALTQWLDAGDSCLLMSGQDIHWDHGLTPLMEDYLGIASVDDDTGQTTVTGTDLVFGGLGPYTLDYPFNNYSDRVNPQPNAAIGFLGDMGPAGIANSTELYRTVFLGFPFEAIPGPDDRRETMARFLEYCTIRFGDGFETGDMSEWSLVVQ